MSYHVAIQQSGITFLPGHSLALSIGPGAPANPPDVASISPSVGSTAGGTAVTLTGTDFVTGASVAIGGVACTSVTVVSATSITATTGAHAAGATDVVVTNPDTQTDTLASGFTYQTPWANTKALKLGSNKYLVGGDVHSYERTDSFFGNMWVKTAAGFNPASSHQLIQKTLFTGPAYRGWQLIYYGNQLHFILRNNNGTGNEIDAYASVVLSASTIYRITWSYDGSSTAAGMKLWLNGALQSLTATTDGLTQTMVTSANFSIGGHPSASDRYFQGIVDETVLGFGSTLTQANVDAFASGGNAVDPSVHPKAAFFTAYYRMGEAPDDANFPTFADRIGSANLTSVNGVSGDIIAVPSSTKSIQMAAGKYVTLGTGLNAYLNRTTAFSISAWFNKDGSGLYNAICSNQDPANGYKGMTFIYHVGNNAYGFQLIGQNGGYIYVIPTGSGANVSSNAWHHVVVTYSGSSNATGVKIYTDGVEASSYTISSNTLNSDALSAIALRVGNDASDSGFPGKIDDLSFFSRALSGAEVTTIYNAGNPSDLSAMSGLLSWYPFENNVNDVMGLNNGTAVGSPTYSTSVP